VNKISNIANWANFRPDQLDKIGEKPLAYCVIVVQTSPWLHLGFVS
jgi:hypothetical protein